MAFYGAKCSERGPARAACRRKTWTGDKNSIVHCATGTQIFSRIVLDEKKRLSRRDRYDTLFGAKTQTDRDKEDGEQRTQLPIRSCDAAALITCRLSFCCAINNCRYIFDAAATVFVRLTFIITRR